MNVNRLKCALFSIFCKLGEGFDRVRKLVADELREHLLGLKYRGIFVWICLQMKREHIQGNQIKRVEFFGVQRLPKDLAESFGVLFKVIG